MSFVRWVQQRRRRSKDEREAAAAGEEEEEGTVGKHQHQLAPASPKETKKCI